MWVAKAVAIILFLAISIAVTRALTGSPVLPAGLKEGLNGATLHQDDVSVLRGAGVVLPDQFVIVVVEPSKRWSLRDVAHGTCDLTFCAREHGIVVHRHSPGNIVARVVLGLAILFTIVFTFVQYFTGPYLTEAEKTKGGMLVKYAIGLNIGVLFVGLVALAAGHVLPPKWDVFFWELPSSIHWLVPTMKNAWIIVVAGLFLAADLVGSELLRNKEAAIVADAAIVCTLVVSSVLLGLLGDRIDDQFMIAFNTGSLCFHLMIGTLLFEGLVPRSAAVPATNT